MSRHCIPVGVWVFSRSPARTMEWNQIWAKQRCSISPCVHWFASYLTQTFSENQSSPVHHAPSLRIRTADPAQQTATFASQNQSKIEHMMINVFNTPDYQLVASQGHLDFLLCQILRFDPRAKHIDLIINGQSRVCVGNPVSPSLSPTQRSRTVWGWDVI